jgi:CRISPR-associated exonuclease Cas4
LDYPHWNYCSVACVFVLFLWGDHIDYLLLGLFLLIGSLVVLAAGLKLRSTVKTEKTRHGIPEGLILYSDLNIPATPLFSRRSGLVGKPDYIVQQEGHSVPVEVKTGRNSSPQQSHVMQLAAYCQLLEDTSGDFVSKGILVYNNVPYTIAFDPKLRFELESVMDSMRDSLRNGGVERNHQEQGRCFHCSMRQYCTDRVI